MSRLSLPYRECPECHYVHAARVCHICKTPIHAVPLDAADESEVSSPSGDLPADLPPWSAGIFSSGRRSA